MRTTRQANGRAEAWVLLALMCASSASADPPTVNGDFAEGMHQWYVAGDASGERTAIVASAGSPTGIAFRAEADPEPGDTAWSLSMGQVIRVPIEAGDRLTVKVVARSPDAARLGVFFEEVPQHSNRLGGEEWTLTEGFRAYDYRVEADRARAAGASHVALHFASREGVIEVALVEVTVNDQTSRLNLGEALPGPMAMEAGSPMTDGEVPWVSGEGGPAVLPQRAEVLGGAAYGVDLGEGGDDPVVVSRPGSEPLWLEQQATARLWVQSTHPGDRAALRLRAADGTVLLEHEIVLTSSWRQHDAVGVIDPAAEAWSMELDLTGASGSVRWVGGAVQATDDY